jgi:hypothetical protein
MSFFRVNGSASVTAGADQCEAGHAAGAGANTFDTGGLGERAKLMRTSGRCSCTCRRLGARCRRYELMQSVGGATNGTDRSRFCIRSWDYGRICHSRRDIRCKTTESLPLSTRAGPRCSRICGTTASSRWHRKRKAALRAIASARHRPVRSPRTFAGRSFRRFLSIS